VVLGIAAALLLPVFFAFKSIFSSNLNPVLDAFAGVFKGKLGQNLHSLAKITIDVVGEIFKANAGIAAYGIIVIFVIVPFVVNIGKYTFNFMLYSYMTSKNEIGFFSALVKTLNKSTLYALCKLAYNIIFVAVVLAATLGLGIIENEVFITHLLPLVEILALVILFATSQILVLGWVPALIVFDCDVLTAFRKGLKAVRRHFWKIFITNCVYFLVLWAIYFVFGAYTLVVLLPVMTILLAVYDMIAFFSSQGMRFYVDETQIMTPKKLEEVDNINKTAFLL
jgi:hypothetical protein